MMFILPTLFLKQAEKKCVLTSRPSDAIAMAVRCHVPILVTKEVMDTASITPEQEEPVTQSNDEKQSPKKRPAPESSSDRLSIFEDFIDHLDVDDTKKNTPPDENATKPRKPKKA